MAGDLITGDWQIQLGGLLLGAGTPYEIDADTGLVGWDDLPGMDTSDVPRPAAPGSYPGDIYPSSRVVTVLMSVHGDGPGHAANIAALRATTTATLAGETPLTVRLAGQALTAGVRCLQRSIPTGVNYAAGRTPKAMIQLIATDPRRYTASASAETAPPAAVGGITWPVTWPLVWAPGATGGTATVVNTGDYPTPVTITLRGPLTTPAVYRQDTGDVLELTTTMSAGDVAVFDTLAGTLTMNGVPPTQGLLSDRSAPVSSFLMPPGSTALALRDAVADPAARMTVTWRSAYL
jgi:hypothetical protein